MRLWSPHRAQRVAVLTAFALAATGTSVAEAAARPSDSQVVAGLVQRYLTYESALVLDEENPQAAKAGDRPVVAGTAAALASARYSLKIDERVMNQEAGVRFRSVLTKTAVERQSVAGSGASIDVVESTAYRYADGSPDYSYNAHHRFRLAKSGKRWAISGIETLDPGSPLSAVRLGAVRTQSALARRAAAVKRISAAAVALRRDLPQLLAVDQAKRNGQSPVVRDAGTAGAASVTAPKSGVARPAAKPLTSVSAAAARRGYNYKKMVDWAIKYSKGRKVDYKRDTNDCTTFISMALGKGGWKEKTGWFKSYSAWWYNCDWCKPRHSYTFGAAYNWQVFAYSKSKRVKALKYMTDLAYADVGQLDINGYGRPQGPDHTMMVTGRNSRGWALMSYHSHDTRNEPLNLILGRNDGPYWALRT